MILMDNRNPDLPPGSKPHFDYGYIIVIASFLVAMMVVGLFVSTGVFYKPMLSDFGWARAALSAPIAVSAAVNGLLSIVMGGLSDKIGPRKVVILCGILAGAGYLLMAWA
jgi:MFS family permease